METLVVVVAVVITFAALSIAIAVSVKVVKLQPVRQLLDRLVSTRGFPWLVLGLAATFVYGLLGQSLLLPLLVTAGGIIATAIGLIRRNGDP
jgi:hypothetical protein